MKKSSCAKNSVFRGKIIIFMNSIYGYLSNGHLRESSIDRHTKLTASTFVVEVILRPRTSCQLAAVVNETAKGCIRREARGGYGSSSLIVPPSLQNA
jgi:hypothetical protein